MFSYTQIILSTTDCLRYRESVSCSFYSLSIVFKLRLLGLKSSLAMHLLGPYLSGHHDAVGTVTTSAPLLCVRPTYLADASFLGFSLCFTYYSHCRLIFQVIRIAMASHQHLSPGSFNRMQPFFAAEDWCRTEHGLQFTSFDDCMFNIVFYIRFRNDLQDQFSL